MRNPSQLRRLCHFAVNESIVEADLRRFDPCVSVVVTPQACPIERAEAHRSGLAAGVDVAGRQVERAKQRAGSANGYDLGMRGRVIARRNLIPALRDDRIVADNDCAEWPAAIRAHFLKRKRDRASHKTVFRHDSFIHLASGPRLRPIRGTNQLTGCLPSSRRSSPTWRARAFKPPQRVSESRPSFTTS